ncbi:CPBP family intramembrane glutamic endopeptidase [Paenibacillus senegalensis]|uniref:CPBP family intramembrane glutamic endopeptidase n=1 Tax=Paenibacillus senegalensis TaxID=1465766 RepID=UPI0002897B4C|nr:CPBP family intramembrane glutamic endopeptidase [Paenibacillus senegalensis]
MIPHKFNRSLALLAVAGIILYFGAILISPLLSGDLEEDLSRPTVTKEEAGRLAEQLVMSLEPDYRITDTTVLFQTDKTLSAYLQQQKLAQDYKQQYGDRHPVDFWEIRISGEAAQPMWVLRVSMTIPEVTSWNKLSSSAIASSSTQDRRAAADAYLLEQGYDLSRFQLIPGSASNLFVYESLDQQIGESVLELALKFTGDTISGFMPSFSVPDNFKLWLAKEEALAGTMSWIALAGTFVINLAAIILVIINRKEVLFVRGIVFAIIFALIYFIHTVNSLPGVSTQVSPQEAAFMNMFYIFFTFGLVALLAVAQYFTAISGEQLWRKEGWNSWPRWREAHFGREVFYAMGRGYLICLFILGVQQFLFLIAGVGFDSFAISDPTQSVHNLYIPALFPLLAWMAAISEEIIYRLFAISAFKKLFRLPVIAIIISSIIWALGHTGYTIYPSYTRLFEVAVLGIIFGYMFLKYGLFTVIFAHAIMNSTLMAMSLMFTLGTPADIAWGLFYIAFPAILGYVLMWLHTWSRRNKRDDGLPAGPVSYWNRPAPAGSKPYGTDAPPSPEPYSTRNDNEYWSSRR